MTQKPFFICAGVWLALTAMVLSTPVLAVQDTADKEQTAFIDGFPDVPLLDIVTGFEGEPLVFDTLAGTVAEVRLLMAVPHHEVFQSYNNALTALGWQCDDKINKLVCMREGSLLGLSAPLPDQPDTSFILRLEPR